MKVTAPEGLKVPYEDNPHRYITSHDEVDVPMTAYYFRRLAAGELVRLSDDEHTTEVSLEPKARGKK